MPACPTLSPPFVCPLVFFFFARQAVNDEGTGTEVDALELFDWSLESLLLCLPSGAAAAEALLSLLNAAAPSALPPSTSSSPSPLRPSPPRFQLTDALRVDVLLAVCARVACTIFWRWPRRKDAPRFIAQVLTLAHQEGEGCGNGVWVGSLPCGVGREDLGGKGGGELGGLVFSYGCVRTASTWVFCIGLCIG